MEISVDRGEDTEEDANSKSGVCLESGEYESFDNNEPDLEENITPKDQGDKNSIAGDLYNQL